MLGLLGYRESERGWVGILMDRDGSVDFFDSFFSQEQSHSGSVGLVGDVEEVEYFMDLV